MADLEAMLAELAMLRAEHAETVRVTRGVDQGAVRAQGARILELVDRIEAEAGKWSTLEVNLRRRAEGLPPLEHLTDLAEHPENYAEKYDGGTGQPPPRC